MAALCSASLALAVACAFLLWTRERKPPFDARAALGDPGLREAVVRRLADDAVGIWDSHNDPEVGRVMLANLKDRIATGVSHRTNALGLREKDFALPKPAGMLRVVLLGDSFIHGYGVEAEQRAGVFLERYLRERASGWTGEIECLHVGVGAWNTVAECAWLRRMLTELAPDLVLQFLISNDLDDHAGVRGFGALSAFAPLEPAHTDALVSSEFPTRYSPARSLNFLLMAADRESERCYERMAAAIGRVVPLVRRYGGRYVVLSHFAGNTGKAWRFLAGVIEEEEFAVLPYRLLDEEGLVLSPSDGHWTEKGHELVARLLYTLIRARDLLPELHLQPWPEVEAPARAELEQAWKASMRAPRSEPKGPRRGLSSLEPARFTEFEWRHVYTGLDELGQVSPFASFYLARDGQESLLLRGRALDRPELAGARVRVSVEGIAIGEHELVPGQPFELRFPLPAEVERRRGIAVRLESSDYGYAGPDRQHCISFVLEKLALE